MSRLENSLKVTVLTQSANFFSLAPKKLPDPRFQPLKVATSIPAPFGGGGYLVQVLLGMCRWPLRTVLKILKQQQEPFSNRESSYF